MSTIIPRALVLDRFEDSFVDDKEGKTVVYFQVRLFDADEGQFYVVSTLAGDSLAALEPGTTVTNYECEFVASTNIQAIKVKPFGASAVTTRKRF